MNPDAPVTATLNARSTPSQPPPEPSVLAQAATWREREITWSMIP